MAELRNWYPAKGAPEHTAVMTKQDNGIDPPHSFQMLKRIGQRWYTPFTPVTPVDAPTHWSPA